MAALIVLLVVAVSVLIVLARTVRIIPQAGAGVVERLGRYSRTLDAGLTIVVPFVDRLRPLIDLREQVVSFRPQPVITEDNLVVSIDSVIYFQVTDPKAASYEIANYIEAIEQLTVATLRNVVGGMSLEDTLTSRDQINNQLRGVLDEATGKWGVRVNRVELKAIDPPATIQEAMEKQMRADRDKRAAILNAEGVKQSQILTAEGEKQSAILRAEGAGGGGRAGGGEARGGGGARHVERRVADGDGLGGRPVARTSPARARSGEPALRPRSRTRPGRAGRSDRGRAAPSAPGPSAPDFRSGGRAARGARPRRAWPRRRPARANRRCPRARAGRRSARRCGRTSARGRSREGRAPALAEAPSRPGGARPRPPPCRRARAPR